MSLNKWIAVFHAVITGSVFLPWSNSIEFGYANIVSKINLQFGFSRPAGWVILFFSATYYLVDIFLKKTESEIKERLKLYLIWALLFISSAETFSVVTLSGNGLFIPQLGLIIAFMASLILVIIYNRK